ncbi:PQQ-binding-like beta-propeller repeat protein, partial [candidate division WOR-3 bacterium]|nr:PQQ-binding-like beta-propeller repeat protein [candidate division WOR-3 bacterium]
LTSNVWTTALSPGDSLLFVGTSSGWSRLDSTLFCINPWNGEIIWKLPINSVLYPLTITDSLIFSAVTAIYSVDFTGNILWEMWGDTSVFPPIGFDNSPAYLNNRVYIGGENSALLSLDAYTGETLWVYPTENWIWHAPVIYDSLIFISVGGWPRKVSAVSANSGELMWQSDTTGDCVAACNGKVYTGVSYWTAGDSLVGGRSYSYDVNDGSTVWDIDLFGGRTSDPNRIISGDGTLWWMPQWIVGINAENGRVRFISDSLPDSTLDNLCYTFFFPIFYERYVLRGYRRKIYLYEASESPPDTLNTNSLISIPNPFSSSVQIIGKTEENTLFIYDLMGRRVRNIEGAAGSYGYMYFIWDGRDERGKFCPNGVYIMKVGSLKGKTIYLKRR